MDTSTIMVLAGTAAVLAGGLLAYLLLLQRTRRQEAAVFHHFRCPDCRRRLRFQSRQVGRKGECSHGGHAVTFPPISQAVD